jgi:DNA-binding IclR family transcriptional regulator
MATQRSSHVQAFEKGYKLLDLLSRDHRSYRTREIAHAIDLPKPMLHKILSTRFNLGFVSQDPDSKDYFLGFR